MKSLQESLFDDDLVKKGVSIDLDTLRDVLFDFGRKRIKLFNKSGVVYREGKQAIFIRKFIGDYEGDEVCFELKFSIIGSSPDGAKFEVPELIIRDEFYEASAYYAGTWASSRSDEYGTKRKIDSVVDLENNDHRMSTIEATNNNITKVFDLYDSMLKEFCSPEFEKELKKYIERYDKIKAIPGLILDILMKKLITKK